MHVFVPEPGTLVWIRQRRWRVERAARDRNVVRLDVAGRDRTLTFFAPFDRPNATTDASNPRLVRPRQAMARLADLLANMDGVRSVSSAVRAQVQILPHQLEPVSAVLGGARRVLIADEVGLGKTIQAGLVVAELVRRLPAVRALIVVPAALRDQWREELADRVGVRAEVADRQAWEDIVADGRFGANPWRHAGVRIASVDYLKQQHVLDAIPLAPWDVVIIDEAHDVCGGSDRYEACDRLARRARHVLLLTATPHSGDDVRFARLERLGMLRDVPDRLTVFRRTRAELALPGRRRVRWLGVLPSSAEAHVLDALMALERLVLETAGPARRDAAVLLLSVFRKRALSTMHALDISLERRLSWIDNRGGARDPDWLQPRLAFDDQTDEISEEDRGGLTVDVGLNADRERRWLGRLRVLAQTAARHETKLIQLASITRRTSEALIVFTEFRHSLVTIAQRLAVTRPVATIHGGQDSGERREALRRFLGGEASVLVATDVGAQGLNLQSRARWVTSFELPWNPARLEQRIGRVDRIGQLRRVHATLLVRRHVAESGLLTTLARRTLAARHAIGNDVLLDVTPPSEKAIAEALLNGSGKDMTGQSVGRLTPCLEWRRTARAEARQLAYRRALGSRWHGPDAGARPSIVTTVRRLPRFATLANRGVLVVLSVPLLDGTGVVVERRVLVLRLEGGWLGARLNAEALRTIVLTRLRGRLERVRRLTVRRLQRRLQVERAIARDFCTTVDVKETQPELFGTRASAEAGDRDQTDDPFREAEMRIRSLVRSGALEIGRPMIALVLRSR